MKKLKYVLLSLSFAMMGYSSALHAEDTDIYVANATNLGTPNVLLVIDNGADFSASANIGCSGYLDGSGPPSTGTDNTAGVLQCALVATIQGLKDKAVNIGIMVSNGNNFANTQATTNPAKGGYHELCMNTQDGGCLLRKLTPMDAAGKAGLIAFVKGWQLSNKNGGNTADQFIIKQSQSNQAEVMQEAWAYFNGKIGMSGKNYGTSILAAGCQKNFVVYISNTQKKPNSNESGPAFSALSDPQVGATSKQLQGITGVVQFTPPVCSSTSFYTLAAGNNWADEWARLMYQKNGGSSTMVGVQNIITYSIGIQSSANSCSEDTYGLIASMANVGGGQFFNTATVEDLKNAFDTILNQVQAVNSVFSSASLPVSVNADGSYLNQIYLGMFRPDTLARPRWLGNLKQYHLIKNKVGALVQGDAKTPSEPAINPDTGFIMPNAVSFWTSGPTTSSLPDSVGGFWVNATASQGVLATGYDSPDGEVVEKGGVSQRLRLENLKANFTATAQTSSNPRRMYVYCPTGSNCVGDLTNTANQFSTANSGIPTDAFGTDTVVPVASIVRTGTTAVVTTQGNHGLSSGATVTIEGASQPEYNVTQSVTVNSSTTFTITGLPDFPTTPSQGTYQIAPPNSSSSVFNITSMSRATHATGGLNTETVTVTTDAPHGFTTASNIQISGATPAIYNYAGTPASIPSPTSFTFNVAVSPPATTTANTYTMQFSPTAYAAQSVTLTNGTAGQIDGTTNSAHGLHAGQQVVITGAGNNSKYSGTYTLASVTNTTFTITGLNIKNQSSENGTVRVDTTAKTIGTLGRVATTDSALATATGLPSNWFGAAPGDTATVNIGPSTGGAYALSGVVATCVDSNCTKLTYPITVTPPSNIALNSATVGLANASTTNIAAGQITRSGTTATVTGLPSGRYTTGQSLTISATGSALASEAGYLGTWQITCNTGCTSFTFGPVPLTPSTPATGSGITVTSSGTPPDRNTLIRWIRGEDNFGGENGPGNGVTVRGSVHGDVLHSRPQVINYGDSRGIVVFYGANDGVYRAVNGNQLSGNIGGVPPGGEIWGLVLPDHFGQYNRQRLNSPALRFPSTTLASARTKDYFVDGQTAAYQKVTASGTISTAYIFLTMRRGGRSIYALDVTQPTQPNVMWKVDSTTAGFEDLGQTWSRPRATTVQGGGLGFSTPVLIFGGGYDPAEDSEPPGADTMGRGIYMVNAKTGAIIWRASPTCTTSATCLNVPGMRWAIPSDIAFVDRDGNGQIDKLYFGDMGGNIWRADVADPDTTKWSVIKLASLGCDDGNLPQNGVCSDGVAPRKFFFPPAIVSVKSAGDPDAFDAISIPSGDREHPLKNDSNSASSYYVHDKFFMINDRGTAVVSSGPYSGAKTSNVTKATLVDATSALTDTTYKYDGSGDGFYISFDRAEKGVNAPLVTEGTVFFATNRPVPPEATCSPNLGEAKAYAVSPFTGATTTNVLVGGGLPPSPVAGLITIPGENGGPPSLEKFCIGCAAACTSCSPLENSPPQNAIPKNLRRTYWYKK